MPRPVISYDKDLPEIPDRYPHLPPTSYLQRKEGTEDEFEIVDGRRPSKMLLVNKLRAAVDQWRSEGYPGASWVTQRLFNYWFDEDHLVDGEVFRYYFGQREAIETLAYIVEVADIQDAKVLVDTFAEVFQVDLLSKSIEHQTTMDGRRQIRRYFPELGTDGLQDLPPPNLRRYAFKMATGSGKTVVMAMAMVWAYFHKKLVPGSNLSTNFLVLAPNVIVYQRLEKDFASNRIFHYLPLVPPEWSWDVKVILRGESTEPAPSGNLFLTNIHQLYESRQREWTPINAVDALLGRKPSQNLASQERPMLERLKDLPDLIAINDEAHHVHDEKLAWSKSLMSIHEAIPGGLALWLDFSATPKDQNGTYYPWIICDYPLAQAVEDRIVKAPLIVHQVNKADPPKVTRDNVVEVYGDWILAALSRWKEHYQTYKALGPKPVLFIMAEKNQYADRIGNWLIKTKETGLRESEVLVIHTDSEGEVRKSDLEGLRLKARDIDEPHNKVKVIVSVLMLREGWDVRNVTVVLGLRPFTSEARILPEQGVGRGLRLMRGISPDNTQTLEVMGTKAFEDFVRQLEVEGLGVKTTTTPPPPPIQIEPVREKMEYDITLPLTKPVYTHEYRKLDSIDPLSLDPIYDQQDLEERFRLRLRMEFMTTETTVHEVDIATGSPPIAQDLLSSITNKVMARVGLAGVFAQLYPIVRTYVAERCFGKTVDLDDERIRQHLRQPVLQEGIAGYLARKIGALVAVKRDIQFHDVSFKLSDTKPFVWRRKHVTCKHTIFNYVASYNDFETRFAGFLDECPDIPRFAALGTTEQSAATQFKVDYLKPSGAIGFYHPDWVAIQATPEGVVNWIIETKGRKWEDTEYKDAAIQDWCNKVSQQTGADWRYVRVDQVVFDTGTFRSFQELLEVIRGQGGTAMLQL
jgi:type III restriction enzyme